MVNFFYKAVYNRARLLLASQASGVTLDIYCGNVFLCVYGLT